MKTSRRVLAVLAYMVISSLSSPTHAELESRLGGKAYYDTVLNITWQTDANAISGTAWDDGSSTTDGFVSWLSAKNWVSGLQINGISGWRLPNMDIDGNQVIVDCRYASETDCRDNEYGYMYEHNGVSAVNPGQFSVPAYAFWSMTVYLPLPNLVWEFNMDNGIQHPLGKSYTRHAWAVRDGDVALYKNGVPNITLGTIDYGQPTYVTYDNFAVTEAGVMVGMEWLGSEPAAGYYLGTDFSIYSGPPNPGNLIVSGNATAVRRDTGIVLANGESVYEYSITGLQASLAPTATYYLGLTQNGLGEGAGWVRASDSLFANGVYQSINGTLNGPFAGDTYFRIVGYVSPDTDGDGIVDALDTDDDNDGLLDIYETNTGSYVSPTDTGSDPLNPDTDGDTYHDGIEVVLGSDPNIFLSVPSYEPGDIAPRGAPDGIVDMADALLAMRIAMGQILPSAAEMVRADVAPLAGPDGKLDVADALLIMRKALGLITF